MLRPLVQPLRHDWIEHVNAELQVGLDPEQRKIMVENVLLAERLQQTGSDLCDLIPDCYFTLG